MNSLLQRNRNGISCKGATLTSKLTGNQFKGNAKCGINVETTRGMKPKHLQVLKNEIVDSGYAGVCVSSAEDVTVKDSIIRNAKSSSAYCYDIDNAASVNLEHTTCDAKSNNVNAPRGGDAKCATGIAFKDSCCPKKCGTCGDVGCGRRLKNHVCCVTSIRAMKKSCNTNMPPCLISKA